MPICDSISFQTVDSIPPDVCVFNACVPNALLGKLKFLWHGTI